MYGVALSLSYLYSTARPCCQLHFIFITSYVTGRFVISSLPKAFVFMVYRTVLLYLKFHCRYAGPATKGGEMGLSPFYGSQSFTFPIPP